MKPPCPRARPTALLRIVVAVATSTLLAGCSPGSGTGTGTDSSAERPDQTAAMEHIHGLGIDPTDGALYAGTHYGLFRVPNSGEPTRIGDVQDYMGFTVVGPNHFLASGHPGEGQGGPSSVGLIESKDGGKTWTPLSLSGEADFHSLDDLDGTIYGLDSMSGQLMTSGDGRSWDVRSTPAIADFALDPGTPGTLVATTQEGPAVSTDDGASFQLLTSAPLLVLVDWAADGTLVGLAPDGTLHRSSDGGATWEARGTLAGPPEALVIDNADTVYAAANGQVFSSTDGGTTFTAVTTAN